MIIVKEINCPKAICEEYIQSLNLREIYFERSNNNCYCTNHHRDTRQKTKSKGGYNYAVPYGWTRFGLKTDKAFCATRKVFERWATSYYGTPVDRLEPILRNRQFPFPGDKLFDEIIFAPDVYDRRSCETSPSIQYASHPQFSPKQRFVSNNGDAYDIQVVLQCKQKPDTITVQPGTLGLCDVIPYQQIVWKTRTRSTIVPCGLMLRIIRRR